MDQDTYIEILAQDIGLDTRAKRNDWISLRVYHKISSLADLSVAEKSMIINLMKEKKYAD